MSKPISPARYTWSCWRAFSSYDIFRFHFCNYLTRRRCDVRRFRIRRL